MWSLSFYLQAVPTPIFPQLSGIIVAPPPKKKEPGSQQKGQTSYRATLKASSLEHSQYFVWTSSSLEKSLFSGGSQYLIWHRTQIIRGKIKNLSPTPPSSMFKLHTIALTSHANKVIMLKIRQARCQQYTNWELPDLKKAGELEIKMPTSVGS